MSRRVKTTCAKSPGDYCLRLSRCVTYGSQLTIVGPSHSHRNLAKEQQRLQRILVLGNKCSAIGPVVDP